MQLVGGDPAAALRAGLVEPVALPLGQAQARLSAQGERRRPMLRAAPGTRVLFVRHGRVHNPSGVIYGRMPRMRLSEQGIEEVQRTARLLAFVPITAFYTSPLLRARQTATILAGAHPGAPIHRSTSLIEVLTSWEGEARSVENQIPRFSYYDPRRDDGDETILDVFDRMDRALRRVAARHPGETSLCVSHGDPIKILTLGYLGKELTLEEVRAPDPPEGSAVVFQFVDNQALPIIDLWIPRAFIRPRVSPPSNSSPLTPHPNPPPQEGREAAHRLGYRRLALK